MKKLTRRSFIGLSAAAGATMMLAGCSNGGEKEEQGGEGEEQQGGEAAPVKMRFVTGGEAGTYYAVGNVIAQHATNNAGLEVTALAGNGSQANVIDLEDGNAELAFCQSDVMAYAYNGTNLFDGAPVGIFSTVACLYDEQVQIVTCNPEIKTVADLKGKNVSIGAAGSGVYFNAIDILGAYDLKESDIKPTYESFADSANSLKDGKIDAAFVVAGAPTTAITDLATTKAAYLVALDDAHVEALLKVSPYYSKAVIAAGTYSGQEADVTTVAVGAVVLAADKLPEDAVYALTADIFNNLEELKTSHAKFNEFSLEKAASITAVPYHAGAAKYFAEKNLTVATK